MSKGFEIGLSVKMFRHINQTAFWCSLFKSWVLLASRLMTESPEKVWIYSVLVSIYDRCEANIQSLAENGITPETQKIFLDAITSFNNALETPRTKIGEKKKATEKLAILFDTADKAIELMDYAVGIVEDEQLDFATAYWTNRKLVETNTGNVSLRAKAIDLMNGTPLKGVTFTFKAESVKMNLPGGVVDLVKKTAEKGSFHVKNMPSGTYKVVVYKPGYKEKEVSVSVADGERSELEVELEKT
jgi:hypothetical protein